ncbi:MAG: PAS domain S-box protein [Dehalococcoidia bacterium]
MQVTGRHPPHDTISQQQAIPTRGRKSNYVVSGGQGDKEPRGLRASRADEQHESVRGPLVGSEASFQLLVEGVQDYTIFMLDPEGRIISWNAGAERIKGYREEEIIGQHFSLFYTQEDLADGKPDRELIIAAKEGRLEDEGLRVRKDGSHFWANVVISPLRDDAGALRGFAKVTRDLTERKQAEEEVLAERRRLQALIDTSPVGVLVAEAGGQVVLANQEAQRIFGFTHEPGDSLNRYAEAATYKRPDGQAYNLAELPFYRVLDQGESVRAEEVRLEFPDGRKIPVLVNTTAVLSGDGRVNTAIIALQDIAPLEQVEKLRTEFLGMVSHELRAPLTAIKGSAATALGSPQTFDDIEIRDLFQIINEQSDRLRDLVNNLLDMTRIDAGALSVNTEPTDLMEVIKEGHKSFVRSGGSNDVRLTVPEDPPLIQADRRRVCQVLTNLLTNAAKYSSPSAPIDLQVEYDALFASVHVRDRGRGIPRDKLPHLFSKFAQVHEDDRYQLSGSGLGLAICKGIVEAHGGRIWADSPGDGQGATFTFTVPVAHKARDSASAETFKGDRSDSLRSGRQVRILSVDDDPQTLRYLRRCLEGEGYQLISTSDPSKVAGLVELECPDLVLLDLMLPGFSGFDLFQQIKEFSSVPVIFLTAVDRDEDVVHALTMGAYDYITKPFSPSELLARIGAALRRHTMPEETDVSPQFILDDLTIDFPARHVTIGGKTIPLSATEYRLLHELATHAGRVLTHDQILEKVWGAEYAGGIDVLRSFIRNLRRKLGDQAQRPRYIFTEPQVGYRMPRAQSPVDLGGGSNR